MDAMSQNDFTCALELGKLLDDHKGQDTVVMDMRSLGFWTDFFVITTAASGTHLSGLERHIKDFAAEKGLDILRRSRRTDRIAAVQSEEQGFSGEWQLLDLGNIVVHLMTAKTRSFYELERLWGGAPLVFRGGESGSGLTPTPARVT